jgi:hypothetical protein
VTRKTSSQVSAAYSVISAFPTQLGRLPSAARWYCTFGGPHVRKLRETAKLGEFELKGAVPLPIIDFEAAKAKRVFPKHEQRTYEPLECVVWDMIGKFKVPSLKGAYYSHNAVDRGLKLRFVYPVTRADADCFIEVLTAFLAFVVSLPKMFVMRILRADAGSVYTAKKVREFLASRGIFLQIAAPQAPHQISAAERNHGVLLCTMRAIMAFCNAPNGFWALALKYAAVLNNHMAVDYQSGSPQIPWLAVGGRLDLDALLIFGCLVILVKTKAQVDDGKLSQRGVVAVFVGWALDDGTKSIFAYTTDGNLVKSVFYLADYTYFPLRPAGERRLLPSGRFGSEGEVESRFRELSFKPSQLLDSMDNASVAPDAEPAPHTSPMNVDRPTPDAEVEGEPEAEPEPTPVRGRDGLEMRDGSDIELISDVTRIRFKFNPPHGLCDGIYRGDAYHKADRTRGLSRVRWDDGETSPLVRLKEDNYFSGNNIHDMEAGEWTITGFSSIHTLSALTHEAHVEATVFARDYSDAEGLLVPALPAVTDRGPFTWRQAQRHERWPEFEAALETELTKIVDNETYDLVDESEAIQLGLPVFDSKFVFTISRSDVCKCREVVRGDQQDMAAPNTDADDMADFLDDDDEDDAEDSAGLVVDVGVHDHIDLAEVIDAVAMSGTDWKSPERRHQRADPPVRERSRSRDRGTTVSPAQPERVLPDPRDLGEGEPEPGVTAADMPEAEILAALSAQDRFDGQFNGVFEALSTKAKNVYRQLFSPVMTTTVMLILLSVAVQNGECIFICDVAGAFLYAPLLPGERIYVRPPRGCENHPRFRGKIMRLKKALYGIRQAPRRWWQKLSDVFAEHGLVRTRVEPCLFVRRADADGPSIKAGTHVDDVLFTSNDKRRFLAWFEKIEKIFKISKKQFIGTAAADYMSLQISYDIAKRYLRISMETYMRKALERFGLTKAKSADTPFAPGVKFRQEDMPSEPAVRNVDAAHQMLGVANWIVRLGCHEATFAVSYLSQFMRNPNGGVLKAIVRIFRYFKWLLENDCEGVEVRPVRRGDMWHRHKLLPNQTRSHTDATFLSEEMSESRMGFEWHVNHMCVYCKSGKIPKICLSSTEAEYVALVLSCIVGVYIRMVLEAIGEEQHGPSLVGQDNSSTIKVAENPGQSIGRTKHIDVRIRWIEQAIEQEIMALVKVSTSQMMADVLTKALPYAQHAVCAEYLRGVKFPSESS